MIDLNVFTNTNYPGWIMSTWFASTDDGTTTGAALPTFATLDSSAGTLTINTATSSFANTYYIKYAVVDPSGNR